MLKKIRQTAVRGKIPAFFASVTLHIILLFMAGSFVAVEISLRVEAKFVARQVVRPKMKLKKLQVPVKIEERVRRQMPKPTGKMVVTARVKTKAVDFKMPEMSGFGGRDVDISYSGLGGSLGFATTQINLFGLKSKGEKFLFLLDTNRRMLIDELGGIPAYKIIKNELITLIQNLPPTALFNVVVFDYGNARAFSKQLSPASGANVTELTAWLEPLNNDLRKIGFSTLPSPGHSLQFEPMAPIYNRQRGWIAGLSYALQSGVDNMYWLGITDNIRGLDKDDWSALKRGKTPKPKKRRERSGGGLDYDTFGDERWKRLVADARKKHNAENARRLKQGRPVRVLESTGDIALVRAYFPSAPVPVSMESGGGGATLRNYTGKDVVDYIKEMSKQYLMIDRRSEKIGLKKKKIVINAIHFVPVDRDTPELTILRTVAMKMRGKYKQLPGLDAIESASRGYDDW